MTEIKFILLKLFRKAILLALAISLSQGFCLSVDENIYKARHSSVKKQPLDIEILYSKPEKKFEIMGDLSIRYNTGYKRDTALAYLRHAAAKNGADAIIMNPIRRAEDKWSISHSSNEDSRNIPVETYVLSGTMIIYLSE